MSSPLPQPRGIYSYRGSAINLHRDLRNRFNLTPPAKRLPLSHFLAGCVAFSLLGLSLAGALAAAI